MLSSKLNRVSELCSFPPLTAGNIQLVGIYLSVTCVVCSYIYTHNMCVFFVTVLDPKTSDQLRSMTKSWPFGFTEKVVFSYRTFYFPGKIKDLPNW